MGSIKQFSQASLQDFSDCKRRYYYRYIAQLTWPAIQAEPVLEIEQLLLVGKRFHSTVYQYLSGIPEDHLENQELLEGKLQTWWENFLKLDLLSKGWSLLPEKQFAVVDDGYKFVAKYDLVALQEDGRVTIFDWKTTSRMPDREKLAARLQTIIYPYVLASTANAIFPGNQIGPEVISMVYWFANFPDSPIVYTYSEQQHEENRSILLDLAEDVSSSVEIENFPLTTDERHCKYCVYRSLCNRGISAGVESDLEEVPEPAFDLDFDQIQEIEF